ncbi:MAG: XcyI family restriction endonuclease [Bryobacteraceae bacterium]
MQISLYSRLQSLRNLYLRDGLRTTIENVNFDLAVLDAELSEKIPVTHLKKLAALGIRGEIVFPVPYLIHRNPFLLGYYRLLYGFSQKAFYEQGPFRELKSVEQRGVVSEPIRSKISALCESLIQSGKALLDVIDPVSADLVHDLQLLTLGPQLRGSNNVDVGQQAVEVAFNLLKGLLVKYTPTIKGRRMTFLNDSALPVLVHFGGDPDISFTQTLGFEDRKLVAIEIKGGRDVSNIWNRLGEAEKSHSSARLKGFNELWTITGVDLGSSPALKKRAEEKSKATTRFFNLDRIVDPSTPDGTSFRQLLGSIIGAKLD